MGNEQLRGKKTPPGYQYSEAFKRMVVREFERGVLNKDQLQVKYGIGGNFRVLEWCRRYGKLPPLPRDCIAWFNESYSLIL